MIRLVKIIYVFFTFLVGTLIVIKSIDYLNPNFHRGFLIGKEDYFFSYYRYALYAHMIGAPVALFSGIIQFLKLKSKWHRFVGGIYVVSILGLASPSGLLMAFHAIGGLHGVISFLVLSSLWFFFTLQAFIAIRTKRIAMHRRFMVRSFILTNSAVSIRVFSFINLQYLHVPVIEAYVVISWLSWMPMLMLYEMFWKK